MRPASIPLVVFLTSLMLVGFTFLPSNVSAPTTDPKGGEGPVLFAYKFPAPCGIDRIAWWAWNPTKRSVWMASPEEGWAEVENNVVLWSAQLEPVPAKAWQQLSGVIPVPGMVEIRAKSVSNGTFLADLPQSVPTAPLPSSGEAAACDRATPAGRRLPLVLRCGWFAEPLARRPDTFEAYQAALAGQGTVISNAITSEPGDRVFTASDAVVAGPDRL